MLEKDEYQRLNSIIMKNKINEALFGISFIMVGICIYKLSLLSSILLILLGALFVVGFINNRDNAKDFVPIDVKVVDKKIIRPSDDIHLSIYFRDSKTGETYRIEDLDAYHNHQVGDRARLLIKDGYVYYLTESQKYIIN